jgi:hypothetical protein
MAKEDWPPLHFTICEVTLSHDGSQRKSFTWSHHIKKGDWVEYDGPEYPERGLIKGMKGVVIDDERIYEKEITTLTSLSEGTHEPEILTHFPVEWMDYTSQQIMQMDRNWTKPSTPLTADDRSRKSIHQHKHIEEKHLHVKHNHYPEAPLINIQDSVVTNSKVQVIKDEKDSQ